MALTTTPTPRSPLLALPLEIRLMIYEFLLLPSETPANYSTSVSNLAPDPYSTYYSTDTNSDAFTLTVRTIDPYMAMHAHQSWRRRSTYHVRTGPFFTSSAPTTYRILLSPHTSHLRHSVSSLLPLNQQIHDEASKILYSTYTFSFHTSIEACVPFLSDLTPRSRSYVRNLAVTKKGLPYTKEFDRAEWGSLCGYLGREMSLSCLQLNVMCGDPGVEESGLVPDIKKHDFEVIQRLGKEFNVGFSADNVDLEWVHQMMHIKGLRRLNVKALVEHCMSPRSESMRFWVAFSKSVEKGFAEWIRGVMLER